MSNFDFLCLCAVNCLKLFLFCSRWLVKEYVWLRFTTFNLAKISLSIYCKLQSPVQSRDIEIYYLLDAWLVSAATWIFYIYIKIPIIINIPHFVVPIPGQDNKAAARWQITSSCLHTSWQSGLNLCRIRFSRRSSVS